MYIRVVMYVVCARVRERCVTLGFFFLMIRRPPRSTLDRSSAASDVYKRQAAGRSRGRGAEAYGQQAVPRQAGDET